jgi:anthranilate phosphoribosyltransferase
MKINTNNDFHYLNNVINQNHYILKKLSEKKNLTSKEIFDVTTNILNGDCTEIFISAFLMSLLLNGESVDEIKGMVEAIKSNAIQISPSVSLPIIDNCGTGGDLLNTFNISTASALVASSCDKVVVAKHGNRSSSSLSGSADFFEYVGCNLDSEPDLIIQSIESIGFGFIFAPKFHPGLKNASTVRKELGLRTIFNVIGPLCNPCTNLYGQIIGVSDPVLLNIVPQIVPFLGLKNAMIVYSHDGMDELSISGKNTIVHVVLQDGEYSFNKAILDPSDLGIPKSKLNDIVVKNRSQSIMETLRVIYGIGSNNSKQNVVLLNSAAILLNGNVVNSFKDGLSVAKDSIDNGSAQKKLRSMIKKCGDISKLEYAEKLL